jgi:hypothetical protein
MMQMHSNQNDSKRTLVTFESKCSMEPHVDDDDDDKDEDEFKRRLTIYKTQIQHYKKEAYRMKDALEETKQAYIDEIERLKGNLKQVQQELIDLQENLNYWRECANSMSVECIHKTSEFYIAPNSK